MHIFSGQHRILWAITVIILYLRSVNCFPISNADDKLDKSEKRYPNGTVVGKYSYTDNKGNPIQVNYFADDKSYGVELKSVKILKSSTEAPTSQTFKQPILNNLLQNTETTLGTSADFYNPTNIKYKINDPFELLNKGKMNNNNLKYFKTSPDYEIYFQNELKTPKKCGKEKVRVYFDKDKRKIREAPHEFDDAAKICSRF